MKALRKSIQAQISLLLVTTLGLSFSAALFFIWTTLDQRFRTLEVRETQTNIARVGEVISNQLNALGERIGDWGDWDDAAEYMQSPNKKFEDANLVEAVLDSMHLDSIRFYQLDGRFHGGVEREADRGLKELLDIELPHHSEIWPSADATSTHSGLIKIQDQYFTFATKLVHPTSGEGPGLGRLVFLSRITDKLPLKVSELTKLRVSMQALSAPEGTKSVQADFQKVEFNDVPSLESAYFQTGREEHIQAYVYTKDSREQLALSFQFSLPRDLLAQGQATTKSVALAFCVCLLISLLALAKGLNDLLVRRVKKLGVEVQDIGSSESHSVQDRVSVIGENEIASLAQHINGMLTIIDEKNTAIRDIVHNVRAGFLKTDRDGVICDGYTDYCHTLFAQTELKGQKLSALLFKKLSDQENFECLYDQVIENIIPEDLTLPQLPNKVCLGSRWLKVEGSGLYNKNHELVSVLFTISDITQQIEVEKRNVANSALLKIIRSLNNFASFKEGVRMIFDHWLSDMDWDAHQVSVRRTMHTLKGNFGVYGLSDIATLVHQIEGESFINKDHVRQLIKAFESFIDSNRDVIGMSYSSAWHPQLTLSRTEFLRLREHAKQWHSLTEATEEASLFIERALRMPFADCLNGLQEEGRRLATRLGKKVEFTIEGGDLLIDQESLRTVFEGLVHALRNAIDHGIESAQERLKAGKPAAGRITFSAKLHDNNTLVIELRDDGRGIQVDKLAKAAAAADTISPSESKALSKDSLLQLIFIDGLSTAQEATDISGRGVGLAALKDEVERLCGRIEVESEIGQGTVLRVTCGDNPNQLPKVA